MTPPPAMPHVLNTYGRLPFALSHGRGCRVWDTEGREYSTRSPASPSTRWAMRTRSSSRPSRTRPAS